jgi:hypothetical protein
MRTRNPENKYIKKKKIMKTVNLVMVLVIIMCKTAAFGQDNEIRKTDKFEFNETGLNDFVVVSIENKTKEEIFSKTMNWVKETYKNPDLVLKMQIPNEILRIDAVASNLASVNNGKTKFNLPYSIEISFKDNKYKFEILSLVVENVKDLKTIPNFKTDKKMIKYWGTTPTDIEIYFNDLNDNLKKYISNQSKKEEW